MEIEKLLITISGQLTELTEEVKGLKEVVGRLEERVEKLEKTVGRLEERVEKLEKTVGRLEERVGKLEEIVGGLEGRVTTLEGRMGRMERDIAEIKQRIGTLDFIEEKVKLIDLLIVKTNQIEEKLDSLNNKFDATINTDIALIFNKQVDMEEGIKYIKHKLKKDNLEHKKFEYELSKIKLQKNYL